MKKILILTIISVLTFNAFKVEAANYDGYIYEGKTIEGIYYKTNENALIEAKVFMKSDSTDTIYSIEYKNNLSGAKEGDYDNTSDYRKTNLTQKQTKRMNLIGYYGYDYQDDLYDHTDIKWYAITQYLIWQVENKNNLIGIVDASGQNIFEEEIKEIEKIIKHHYIRPDFGANKFRVNSYDEITIEDQNHVMSEYKLTGPSDLDYQMQNDKIIATSDKNSSYTFKFNKKDTRYTNPCVFYVSNEYRNAIQIGRYDDISANVIINFISGKVIFSKIGEQLIDFADNNFIYDQRQVTGSTYYIYAKEDTYNNVGKLLFHKDEKVSELTIGEESSIDNLYLTNYYVKEIKNAYPYIADRNIYDIQLDMDNKTKSLDFTGNFQDLLVEFQTVKQEIKYVDGEPKYSYKGVEEISFGLYNSEDIYSDIDSSKPLVNKDTLLVTSVSDENGKVVFDLDIPLGKYYVAKLTEDEKYYGQFEKINFSFTHSTNPKPTYTLMSFYNLLKTQKITFKNDGEPKNIIIYDKNQDSILYKEVTDELSLNLPLGEYFYQIDDSELYPLTVDSQTEDTLDINGNSNTTEDTEIKDTSNDNSTDEVEMDKDNDTTEDTEIKDSSSDDTAAEVETDKDNDTMEDNEIKDTSSDNSADEIETDKDNGTMEDNEIKDTSNDNSTDEVEVDKDNDTTEDTEIKDSSSDDTAAEVETDKDNDIIEDNEINESSNSNIPNDSKDSQENIDNSTDNNTDSISPIDCDNIEGNNNDTGYFDKDDNEDDSKKEDIINNNEDNNQDEFNTTINFPVVDDDNEEISNDNMTIDGDNSWADNKNITTDLLSQNTNKYQEINVEVPATDKFDLSIYVFFIILFMYSLTFINVKS